MRPLHIERSHEIQESTLQRRFLRVQKPEWKALARDLIRKSHQRDLLVS